MKNDNKPEYYSQTTLKSFGFTAKMINTMLSEPILKPNPHYKCAAPMKLWDKTEIETVMQTEEFKKAIKYRESRKKGAAKAIETKRKLLHERILKKIDDIEVVVLDMFTLRQQTIEAKKKWYSHQDCYDVSEIEYVKEETLNRWMVNYIRHNLTDYDYVLYSIHGKIGYKGEYYDYKCAVLDKIAEAYPALKDECEWQKGTTYNADT